MLSENSWSVLERQVAKPSLDDYNRPVLVYTYLIEDSEVPLGYGLKYGRDNREKLA